MEPNGEILGYDIQLSTGKTMMLSSDDTYYEITAGDRVEGATARVSCFVHIIVLYSGPCIVRPLPSKTTYLVKPLFPFKAQISTCVLRHIE